MLHSQPRFTKDIGLFMKANRANTQATIDALAAFGAPLDGVRPEEFADRGSFFRFGRDPHGFYILPDIPASTLTRHGHEGLKAWSMQTAA
jgi:hypothetical protein